MQVAKVFERRLLPFFRLHTGIVNEVADLVVGVEGGSAVVRYHLPQECRMYQLFCDNGVRALEQTYLLACSQVIQSISVPLLLGQVLLVKLLLEGEVCEWRTTWPLVPRAIILFFELSLFFGPILEPKANRLTHSAE